MIYELDHIQYRTRTEDCHTSVSVDWASQLKRLFVPKLKQMKKRLTDGCCLTRWHWFLLRFLCGTFTDGCSYEDEKKTSCNIRVWKMNILSKKPTCRGSEAASRLWSARFCICIEYVKWLVFAKWVNQGQGLNVPALDCWVNFLFVASFLLRIRRSNKEFWKQVSL